MSLYKVVTRPYQDDIVRFFLKWIEDGCSEQRNAVLRWSRRSGKDITSMYLASFLLNYKKCMVYYILHTATIGLDLLHTMIGSTSYQYLDIFANVINTKTSKGNTSGILKFTNGSRLYIYGSKVINDKSTLVGTSPNMIVFSEFPRQNPLIYQYLRPAIIQKKAFCIFPSTPIDIDHFYDLHTNYDTAKSKNWLFSHKSNDITQALTDDELDEEKRVCSKEFIRTEYYAEFPLASPYTKYVYRYLLDTLRDIKDKNKFESIWDILDKDSTSGFTIDIAFDLGFVDQTVVIFCLHYKSRYYILDCYDSNQKLIGHYLSVIEQYIELYNDKYCRCSIGKIYLPTDSKDKTMTSRLTTNAEIKKYFPKATIYDLGRKVSLFEGIHLVKSHLTGIHFANNDSCKRLYSYIYNYSKKEVRDSDETDQLFQTIKHNMASHFADCLRYLIIGGEYSNG